MQILRVCSFALALVLMIGCGSSGHPRFDLGSIERANEGIQSAEYWASIGYETQIVPDGALSDVTALMGGDGFDLVAEDLGYVSNDDKRPMGDPAALVGGALRIPVSDFPSTLRREGRGVNSITMSYVGSMVYESLFSSRMSWDFGPLLATHWKIEENEEGGQTYTFRLNPSARWQTGHRVTAADVVATWRLKTDEGLLSPYTESQYRRFSEPVALSPYLVRTSTASRQWRDLAAFGFMNIYPAHILSEMTAKEYMEEYQNKMMPGSGLYLMKEEDVKTGHSLTITRTNNYWNKDDPTQKGVGNFYQVVFQVVEDPILRREMFKKGELDVLFVGQAKYWVKDFLPEKIPQLAKGWIQRKKVYTQSPNGVSGFVFNMREEPFDDIRVRRAFSYLFNRKRLLEKLFFNEYLPSGSHFPGSVYENPINEQIDYQPKWAQELLAEAGWATRDAEGWLVNARGTRLELNLMCSVSPTWERIMTVIQEDYNSAGIKLNLVPTSGATQYQMLMDRKFKMHWQSWNGGEYPDPSSMYYSDYADQANSNNFMGFRNAELDSICDVYVSTFKQADRIPQLQEIDRILMESYVVALAWHAPYVRMGYWDKFGIPETVLSRTSEGRDIMKYWWYDPHKHQTLLDALERDLTLPVGNLVEEYWRHYTSSVPIEE